MSCPKENVRTSGDFTDQDEYVVLCVVAVVSVKMKLYRVPIPDGPLKASAIAYSGLCISGSTHPSPRTCTPTNC